MYRERSGVLVTQKLYYEDQYQKNFTAEILEIKEVDGKFHVLLDKTAFFPGGGGQFGDTGNIEKHIVLDVYDVEGKVYHVVEEKPIKLHRVKCSIDWDKREDGMQQHFGQHILSGSFYKLLNANTVSFHLGSDISIVDIEGYLNEEDIRKVESFANEKIRENLKVNFLTPSRKELKKMWLRRDLPNTEEEIRVVEIEDLDINACCGVHPSSTGDLRVIKIKRFEKHKKATRVEFLAGKRAVDYMLHRDSYLTRICNYLSCSEEDALNGIANLNKKLDETVSKNKKLEDVVSGYELRDMIDSSKRIGSISVVTKSYKDGDIKYISKLANKVAEHKNSIALFAVEFDDKANLVFSCSEDIKDRVHIGNVLKDAITLIDGNGGGSNTFAQGGGRNNGNVVSALDYAYMKIEKLF
ncbi:alanyl-tRNA editing protein [Metaclostridioides mangenotii]|uniref:alanyl-tRNA editing protein n=1 Tax=Metaclostridioides mangenotii TaxID=1540 RepID=UPI001FA79313|nr:DHHA1 domain-containing protein [Clostridioides mangenotii]